jgi:hypothetical protein
MSRGRLQFGSREQAERNTEMDSGGNNAGLVGLPFQRAYGHKIVGACTGGCEGGQNQGDDLVGACTPITTDAGDETR